MGKSKLKLASKLAKKRVLEQLLKDVQEEDAESDAENQGVFGSGCTWYQVKCIKAWLNKRSACGDGQKSYTTEECEWKYSSRRRWYAGWKHSCWKKTEEC